MAKEKDEANAIIEWIANELGVKKSEVLDALTYNIVIAEIDGQIAFLRENKEQENIA